MVRVFLLLLLCLLCLHAFVSDASAISAASGVRVLEPFVRGESKDVGASIL